jgi:phosphate starvation-inducible protein PhoH and related proteins
MVQTLCEIDNGAVYQKICGVRDKNLKTIESIVNVEIIPRGTSFILKGKEANVASAQNLINALSDYLHDKKDDFEFDEKDIRYLSEMVHQKINVRADDIARLKIVFPESGKSLIPKSFNQALYLSEISKYPIVFGTGPAGTGKTYLAVAAALKSYFDGKVSKIVLTRPAVEAGENLGFLPGSLIEKINPYLRPLYDALFEFMSFERVSKMIETNAIEIAPLAYMRGRTLNNSFIILDEAQNTTINQMKMILTRMGQNSTIVVSGDPTQIDIDKPAQSGLIHAMKILADVSEIRFIHFNKTDICRHPVVQKIVDAYEKGHIS